MTSTQNNENNFQYLDITIRGNENFGDALVEASYRENRTQAILAVPNEWRLGVARFSVPSDNIPLFNFETGAYIVRLYDPARPSNDYSVPVAYVNNHNPSPYGTSFQPIFNYSEFIQLINTALAASYVLLRAGNGAFPGTALNPPQLQFNSSTKIISLYAEIAGWDNDTTTHPLAGRVLFNQALVEFFPGLQENNVPAIPGFTNIVVANRVGNTVTFNTLQYYTMASDFIDVLNWDEISQVIITTTGVPIIPEQKAVGNNQNAVFQSLLTDFNFAGVGFREAGRLQFYNQGNIRYYDLISDNPMTQFDLVFQFSDSFGDIYPIYISPRDSANIKMQFIRKNAYEE